MHVRGPDAAPGDHLMPLGRREVRTPAGEAPPAVPHPLTSARGYLLRFLNCLTARGTKTAMITTGQTIAPRTAWLSIQ